MIRQFRLSLAVAFTAWGLCFAQGAPQDFSSDRKAVLATPGDLPPLVSSLSFGDQKIGSQSPAQTFGGFYPSTPLVAPLAAAITGVNPEDFIQTTSCRGDGCWVVVAFTPHGIGTRSASLTVTYGTGTTVISLAGNAVLTGSFEIVNKLTGKALDISGGSASLGTPIEQNSLNGLSEQRWTFVPTPDGYYKITNAHTGKVLDVTGVSADNGASIQEWDDIGGKNQQWRVVPVNDVHYMIVNRLSGRVLDVTNGSALDEAPIQQWDYQGNPQQLWSLVPPTWYNISSWFSGDMLDVVNGSDADRALIQQWQANGNSQQQWQFLPVGGGYYAIVDRLAGKVLDVPDSSTENGALIQQWEYLGSPNQQWQMLPMPFYNSHGLFVANLFNFRFVNRASGKVLDVKDLSTSNGAVVQQWQDTGYGNQLWTLLPVISYTITNVLSEKVLDIPGGSRDNATVVQQWTPNGNQQQEWQVVLLPTISMGLTPDPPAPFTTGSPFLLINNLSGKALEVPGNSSSSGALIDQSNGTGARNQIWRVTSASGSSGAFEVINNQSEKVLDDTGFSTSNGTVMQQWDSLEGTNQHWTFAPVSN